MDSDYVDRQQRRINELQTRCQRLEQLFKDKTTAENANQQLRNSLESQIQFLQEENERLTNEASNQQSFDNERSLFTNQVKILKRRAEEAEKSTEELKEENNSLRKDLDKFLDGHQHFVNSFREKYTPASGGSPRKRRNLRNSESSYQSTSTNPVQNGIENGNDTLDSSHVTELQQNLDKANEDNAELRQELQLTQQENTKLKSELERSKKPERQSKSNYTIIGLREQLKGISDENTKFRQENNKLKSEVARLHKLEKQQTQQNLKSTSRSSRNAPPDTTSDLPVVSTLDPAPGPSRIADSQTNSDKNSELADKLIDEAKESLNNGNYNAAIEKYRKAIEKEESGRRVPEKLGCAWSDIFTCHYQMSQFHDALDAINKAIEWTPNSDVVYYNRAIAYHEGYNELEKAIADVKMTLSLDPKCKEAKPYLRQLEKELKTKNNQRRR